MILMELVLLKKDIMILKPAIQSMYLILKGHKQRLDIKKEVMLVHSFAIQWILKT